MRKKYIRFGALPEDSKSTIFFHGNMIGKEIGISVFDTVEIDGIWHIVIPMPVTQDTLDDIYKFLNYFYESIYLVEGEQIGTGTDNEPVIKDAEIIADITDMFRNKIKPDNI